MLKYLHVRSFIGLYSLGLITNWIHNFMNDVKQKSVRNDIFISTYHSIKNKAPFVQKHLHIAFLIDLLQ